MSTKSSIIYIDKDGSHIYYETAIRDWDNGAKNFAIIGVIDMRNVIEIDQDVAKDTVKIKLAGNMLDCFTNNTIDLDLSGVEDYSRDDEDVYFMIKPGHPLANNFLNQIKDTK